MNKQFAYSNREPIAVKAVIVSTAHDSTSTTSAPTATTPSPSAARARKMSCTAPKYHDSCGQRLNWEKMAIRGKLKIKK